MNEELQKACDELMAFCEGDDYEENEVENYENAIVEAAIKQRFGPDAYNRINSAIEKHELEETKQWDLQRIATMEHELELLRKKYATEASDGR